MTRQLSLLDAPAVASVAPAMESPARPTGIPARKPVGTMTWEFRRRVLKFIARCGARGATDQEIARALELSIDTARIRRTALVEMGLIVDAGACRPGLSGQRSNVWVVASHFARNIEPSAVAHVQGDTAAPAAPGLALERSDDRSHHAPFACRSDPRGEAAAEIAPHVGRLEGQVYDFIVGQGRRGATDQEAAEQLRIQLDTVRARRVGLRDRGLIVDSGRRRPTRSGRPATVWIGAGKRACCTSGTSTGV